MNKKEKIALDNAKKEIKRLNEALQNADDAALRIRLGQINKEAGFPDNTAGA